MKLKMSVCIEASKEKVWETLSDVTNINLWVDPILSSQYESNKTRGVGTVRVCNLKGNIAVKEEFIAWQEGESYTYQAYGAPLIKSAKNRWSIESVDGKTLLTSESEVEIKGGVFGKLLEPLMYLMSKRMGTNSLAAIKYLIETERPFEGKMATLPKVPMVC